MGQKVTIGDIREEVKQWELRLEEGGAHSTHNEMFAAALCLLLLLKFFVLLLAYSLPPEITHKNSPA